MHNRHSGAFTTGVAVDTALLNSAWVAGGEGKRASLGRES
ncbi:MAG: hypothetical protein V7647_4203 [Acidobacteriota bacterium]|jgi:hypothetical protein